MLDVVHITKSYRSGRGHLKALDQVSFTAAPGQAVAVAGRSGSGKTTLLHCIAGLEVPDEGRIVCHGEDIFQLSEKERQQWLRTGVGIVFQSGNLLSYLTVSDNIAFPLQLGGWSRGDIAQRVDELLQRIALPHAGRALPHELSGGELQRVAVARAIAHRPRIVLADEPTASLDTVTAAALVELLMELSRQENTILLMSTHDPAVMAAANRTVSLADGCIDTSPQGDQR
ncbi:MAG: ABC transporter ATP-binding protein [Deltaproteobacteria bacterium]|nr:ABC transporter ATP-binding protein [Deltaproteobacteria bacterium]